MRCRRSWARRLCRRRLGRRGRRRWRRLERRRDRRRRDRPWARRCGGRRDCAAITISDDATVQTPRDRRSCNKHCQRRMCVSGTPAIRQSDNPRPRQSNVRSRIPRTQCGQLWAMQLQRSLVRSRLRDSPSGRRDGSPGADATGVSKRSAHAAYLHRYTSQSKADHPHVQGTYTCL